MNPAAMTWLLASVLGADDGKAMDGLDTMPCRCIMS